MCQSSLYRSSVSVRRGLKSLVEGNEHQNAEEYVRRTPSQIRTTFRDRIERELGWTARSSVQSRVDASPKASTTAHKSKRFPDALQSLDR